MVVSLVYVCLFVLELAVSNRFACQFEVCECISVCVCVCVFI